MKPTHRPVLLEEVLKVFEDQQLRFFFEGTVGAGGHAQAILQAHPEIQQYFACDRDPKALAISRQNLEPWKKKIEWIQGPFGDVAKYVAKKGVEGLDGFLIDIGVSSMQLDEGERGFSFRVDAPLDMRMDPEEGVSAEALVNELDEKELARIFYEYGEEFRSRAAASAVVRARKKRRIRTTQELVAILDPVLRKGKIHPATKVFQALRIAVNDELGQLQKGLAGAIESLAPNGRIAVICFHSLEDRIVKWFLRKEKNLEILTKKPVGASSKELKENPRSRSAKLRAAKKIASTEVEGET